MQHEYHAAHRPHMNMMRTHARAKNTLGALRLGLVRARCAWLCASNGCKRHGFISTTPVRCGCLRHGVSLYDHKRYAFAMPFSRVRYLHRARLIVSWSLSTRVPSSRNVNVCAVHAGIMLRFLLWRHLLMWRMFGTRRGHRHTEDCNVHFVYE